MRAFIQKAIATVLFCGSIVSNVSAQTGIERKIVIDNGNAYYCTVDNDWQLATLHMAVLNNGMTPERLSELPLGREWKDEFMPLCFDIRGNEMVGFNWITSATNSRNEALKKIKIDELTQVSKAATDASMTAWLERSFTWPYLTSNEPWMVMLRRNNVLDNCYFDMTMLDNGHVVMVICNHNDMTVWEYDGKIWQHSGRLNVNITGYFSLVSLARQTWLITQNGTIFRLDGKEVATTQLIKETQQLGQPLKDVVLIVDRDNKNVRYTEAVQETGNVVQLLGNSKSLLSIE